jgi:8-oxo-dGTP pyrophosphatase MutT (NUDIX family)
VDFLEVARRASDLPARLPPPPVALLPVRTDSGDRRPPAAPEGVAPVESAVLVLVTPDADGSAGVLLTERADRGGHHSGEVSFPGGRAEPGDRDLADTAIREAREEVALDPDQDGFAVIGALSSFWIPVSNFRVTPYLAFANRRPALVPSEAEVARIVWAPIDTFLPGAPIEIVEREVRGWPLRYGGYRIDGLHVWGATARILGQLGALLAV